MATWLLIDSSNLTARTYHGLRDPTGPVEPIVLASVMRQVWALADHLAATGIAWFFDQGTPHRVRIYPSYKQDRRQLSEEEQQARRRVRRLVRRLRQEILQDCPNQFSVDRYEADDLIASVTEHLTASERAVIVSSDKDFYQLLSHRVCLWLPHKGHLFTRKQFVREYGISPSQWADVLALAGCPGDGIVGIAGIGPKRAIQHLQGTLTGQFFERVIAGTHIWKRNLPLVQLPLHGTPKIQLQLEPLCHPKERRELLRRLGIRMKGP